VFPVRYELGFYIPEDGVLHSHRRENLRSYKTVGSDREKDPNLNFLSLPPPPFTTHFGRGLFHRYGNKQATLLKTPSDSGIHRYFTEFIFQSYTSNT
jgi:hypothetical protein